jgi:hypothetical protein
MDDVGQQHERSKTEGRYSAQSSRLDGFIFYIIGKVDTSINIVNTVLE